MAERSCAREQVFEQHYDELAIDRHDVIVPFGLLSMTIQGVSFAWVYDRTFACMARSRRLRVASGAAIGAALSGSFTTIVVATKNVMTSGPGPRRANTADENSRARARARARARQPARYPLRHPLRHPRSAA